jgi:group I intron endonuclease
MIIYKIIHKPSGKFYIGRTIQKLERRVKQHKQQTKSKSRISSLLRKYDQSEFVYQIVDGVIGDKNDINFEHLIELEQKYIDIHILNSKCINLSNSSKGPSLSCLKNRKSNQSKEQKDLFRSNYLNWWNNRTPEQDLKRRKHLQESHNARLIPVNMYDLNMNYINTYPSIRSIVREHKELDRAAILRVLKNKSKYHKDYIFVYINNIGPL